MLVYLFNQQNLDFIVISVNSVKKKKSCLPATLPFASLGSGTNENHCFTDIKKKKNKNRRDTDGVHLLPFDPYPSSALAILLSLYHWDWSKVSLFCNYNDIFCALSSKLKNQVLIPFRLSICCSLHSFITVFQEHFPELKYMSFQMWRAY